MGYLRPFLTEGKRILALSCTFDNTVDSDLFTQVKEELHNYLEKHGDAASKTWGYFPQYDDSSLSYEKTKTLAEKLTLTIRNQLPESLKELELAFIRLAEGEPQSAFGGFHADVDKGVKHERDPASKEKHIVRLLVNFHTHPRTLALVPLSVDQLKKQGFFVDTDHYEMLTIPDDIPVVQYDIAPITDTSFHGILFLSDQLVHAGKTGENGHFMGAFGCYTEVNNLKNL